jgi:queuine tRNA-ribosyltransferase
MGPAPFAFQLHKTDSSSHARRSTLTTAHGRVELPAFMPVGTQGTVKGLTSNLVRETGAQMVLGNTYHLALRPGAETVARLGGLHNFMGWAGPILTDSGGFQVFSLEQLNRVDDTGVVFRSHIDGSQLSLSPERAVEIQELLGSDIAMTLDHVVALPCDRGRLEEACRRTVLWAERSQAASRRADQAVFAIVQGGLDRELRIWCAQQLAAIGFPGYAVGGLSVGETPTEMYEVLDFTCPALPHDRPRYLMGVGRPQDILEAVRRGIDLFDCVMPTRNGRNALAFTAQGALRLRNQRHREDPRPLEAECPCLACQRSRGYLHHLFKAREMLGPILLSLHNLTYYQRLMRGIREAISEDRFADFYRQCKTDWELGESR